ncbi:hypothetical protein GCM10022254_61280 [Actinomadura meridiana]|uniref:XRE family transcriptional regulator n=1 Tax=Actinomadura meridiana TaxID=559626 RepID=A0ABP8CIG9_9ACTN
MVQTEDGPRLMGSLWGALPSKTQVCSLARQIRSYEKGGHFPRDWADAYAEAFGKSPAELFHTIGANVDNVGIVEGEATSNFGDDEVKRRAALQLITALTAGAAIPPGSLEHALSGIDAALGNPLDLDEWDRTVHEYGQRFGTTPPGTFTAALTADIVAVGDLLNRRLPDSDRAGLLRVAAGLSGLLAIDLGDTGDWRAARITWATARRAADGSGDQALRVWVRGRAAQDAFWAGRPVSVTDDLAGEALAINGGALFPGAACALAARAYAAADQGDTATADDALSELEALCEGLPSAVGRSVLGFREPQLRWAESYVRTCTQDVRAATAVGRALALYPSQSRGAVGNLKLMQASVLVEQREVNVGLEQAITAFHASPATTFRSSLAGRILRTLPGEARALPAARELRAITAGV